MISIDMLNDVKLKLKKKNKILFNRDSLVLQNLLELIRVQKHRSLVLWAFRAVEKIADELKHKYPNEKRIDIAINLCKLWAKGEVKMPIAKKAILDVHKIAKDIDNPIDIALIHAIGQGCSAVHVETHAIGIAIYELTAIVLKHGIEDSIGFLEKKITQYINDLKECENQIKDENYKWANFLLDDSKLNKEMLLYDKNIKRSLL